MLNLFKPGKIGKLQIKNRIVMAPMGGGKDIIEPDGKLSQEGIDYYTARAKGGTGLIMTGGARVSQDIEYSGSQLLPAVYSPIYIPRLSELAKSLHSFGAKVVVQLTGGMGRVINTAASGVSGAVAPSPLPCFFDPGITTRELTTEEVERLVHAFELAAETVRTSGIDAVEINAHSGYIVDQFQTAIWNRRTDKYGGDLEGRLRFAREVIKGIKKRAGADFPVIYRLGLTHYLDGGRTVEEGLEIIKKLEVEGVDAFHIDAGCYESRYWPTPPTTQPPGCMVNLAEMAKRVAKVPIIAVGKLGQPELAEEVLQEGKADFIALGRPLLADPDWPNKVREGRPEDIRPCIGCYEGCRPKMTEGSYFSCTVNPATGKERKFTIIPAEKGKSVLVVGGGPAGMEAAMIASQRGHKVTLWEKGNALGGNLIPASIPDFKQEYRTLLNYLSTQVKKLGVTIKLGQQATPQLIEEMNPDVVFIVTGATPVIPEIPGAGKDQVVTATDLLLGKKEAGESVVIIGGGLIGCETALYLAQQGKKVTIIEILDSVAGDMYWVNRAHLLKLVNDASVKILTETKVLEITDEGITISDKSDKRSMLEADSVVLASGMEPNRDLLEALKDKVPEVYALGDCMEPRKVINAIWEGFHTARLI
ncbi:FAD-dependent oxidoreductase [Chloroflexota bacterium]